MIIKIGHRYFDSEDFYEKIIKPRGIKEHTEEEFLNENL